ncbi:MAG TPA: hypothetical protein VFN87_08860 [Solirubrobacteraceae bacterium]|nr:hypothetical protein [Solirubrobacteraceae bacterium]
MGSPHRRLLCLLICALVATGAAPAASAAAARPSPVTALTGLAPSRLATAHACPAPTPGVATCFAQVIVRAGTRTPVHLPRPAHARPAATTAVSAASPALAAEPAGAPAPIPGTAAWLQQAYDLTWLAANGSHDTVAIVDAYGDPTIASDLSQFRAANALPACTTTSGCLTIVNQTGGTTPPSTDTGWDTEQTLDVDAVSSLCPNCHLLLVQANSASWSDLEAAVQTANALGAKQISMSFGADGSPLSGTWTFPGVASLAAGGDYGYQGDWNDTVPATNPGVTAVGGTSLSVSAQSARGIAESTWSLNGGSGTGSGCDLYESKPSWQTDTGCTGRAWNDVSADADPNSGLNIYDTGDGGWEFVGGTSLATPLTAAYEAITAVNGTSPRWAYSDSARLNDIVSGSSGTCTTEPAYVCNAGPGYDGPTGNGSISGAVVAGGPGIGGSWVQSTEPGAAEVAGGVYPNGLDTSYWWEYGTTTAYGQQTTAQDIGSGASIVSIQDVINSLTPGTTYHFRLVAANSDGTSYGPDATFTTAAGVAVEPVDVTAPSVGGAPEQDQTLTANPGTWSASTSFSYQWQAAGSAGGPFIDIAGATGDRYTPTAGDLGRYLRVSVVDDDSGAGMTAATSAAVGPVVIPPPSATTAPSITGTATQGQILTAQDGTWTFPGTIGYAWQRSVSGAWANISGATGATYTLTTDDVATQVRVIVTETNSTGSTAAPSASVGPVAGLVPPQVSSTGQPAPAPTPAPAPIAATTSSGSPSPAPTSPAAGSSPPATPAPPPAVIAAPDLRGQPVLGGRAWVVPGRYRDTAGQTVQYYRCAPGCRPVGHPGAPSYRLGPRDVGAYIAARVILLGPGGETSSWVPGVIGPVTSPNAGVAGLRLGHRALLRGRRAGPLARAQESGATAASLGISSRVRISVSRARVRVRTGTVMVWACVLRGRELIACTPRRSLHRRLVLRVSLVNGERVQVIALRRA